MALHGQAGGERAEATVDVRPQFVRPGEEVVVPRFRMPQDSIAPETAYQIVHDELMLDGNARLNLATFVTTWMDPYADRLMAECAPKNMIDKDEYPQTAELEARCVNILADLWHVPDAAHAVGCSTTGSSEACMLAGLALTRRWRARRRAAGAPADRRTGGPAEHRHGRQRAGVLGEVRPVLGHRGPVGAARAGTHPPDGR